MRSPRALLFAASVAAILAAAPASADILGSPVLSEFNLTPVGTQLPDGYIPYYSPLSGAAVYGVNGGGLSPDICGLSGTPSCSPGGNLDMTLNFAGTIPGASYNLHAEFQDFDVIGANDPPGHIEGLTISQLEGATWLALANWTDASQATFAQVGTQVFDLPLIANDISTTLRLVFLADASGTGLPALNTIEALRPTLTSAVPGPVAGAGLPALIGLLGIGWARRRRATA